MSLSASLSIYWENIHIENFHIDENWADCSEKSFTFKAYLLISKIESFSPINQFYFQILICPSESHHPLSHLKLGDFGAFLLSLFCHFQTWVMMIKIAVFIDAYCVPDTI